MKIQKLKKGKIVFKNDSYKDERLVFIIEGNIISVTNCIVFLTF
jgi:hypothetical protein